MTDHVTSFASKRWFGIFLLQADHVIAKRGK